MNETHAYGASLELRAGGDGRTIVGLCVPFDTPAPITDHLGRYTERVAPGSFTRTIAERGSKVKLLSNHRHDVLPVGRATKLTEDPRGLLGEFRVSKTDAGDEVLELVRDGAVDTFSIGFTAVRDEWPKQGERIIREAHLHEVSVVAFPAYEGALIAGVRSAADDLFLLDLERQRLELRRKRLI